MFSANTYEQRRNELCRKIGKGLILLPGNQNAPNNYPNNAYYFRQDSTFRYYFGLNVPGITGLLDAETNLKYGVKYLRGAYLVARGHHDRTIHWYSSGYYYEAKRMGLLEETGLRS